MSSLSAPQLPDLPDLTPALTHFDGSTLETIEEVKHHLPGDKGADELMDRVAAQLVTTSRLRRRHRLKWFVLVLLAVLAAVGGVLALEYFGHLPPLLTDYYQQHRWLEDIPFDMNW